MTTRDILAGVMRQVVVAVVTGVLLIAFILLVTRGQATAESELQRILVDLQRQTLEATLAEACVLSLPVSPETGRDADDVHECFTQYGLEPPRVIAAG